MNTKVRAGASASVRARADRFSVDNVFPLTHLLPPRFATAASARPHPNVTYGAVRSGPEKFLPRSTKCYAHRTYTHTDALTKYAYKLHASDGVRRPFGKCLSTAHWCALVAGVFLVPKPPFPPNHVMCRTHTHTPTEVK